MALKVVIPFFRANWQSISTNQTNPPIDVELKGKCTGDHWYLMTKITSCVLRIYSFVDIHPREMENCPTRWR